MTPRSRRLLVVAVGLVALIVAVLVVQSLLVDERDAEIVDARLEGPSTLVIGVDACNARSNEVDLTESSDEVVVSVTTDDPAGGDDCADQITVELSDPLGDRRLVDGTTGDPVEVTG